jgi:hypothetical protein
MNDNIHTNEEYVNEADLDEIETPDDIPVAENKDDALNIDASLDDLDAEDFEDSIGSEEDSSNRGGPAATDLRRGLQGGGDDRNDE